MEADGLVEVGDGAVVIVRGTVYAAALVMSQRRFWIEPDSFVEVGDGAVIVSPEGAIHVPPVDEGDGEIWPCLLAGLNQRSAVADNAVRITSEEHVRARGL